MIESEQSHGPAEVDLINEKEVIRYIRDLLNLNGLFPVTADEAISKFTKKLLKVGYSRDRIQQLIAYAAVNTRYEHVEDEFGRRIVPRVLSSSKR